MQLDLPTIKTLGAGFVNLGIFTAIIYKTGKKPFLDFVSTRSKTLHEQIQDAKSQLDVAHTQYSEFKAKLDSIESEVSALRAQNTQDVAGVSTKIREAASQQASQIVAEARLSRDAALIAAKRRIALDVGQQIIERAETLIQSRITGDEKARIRRDFSNQLERIR
jgi:F0F1-type ATP synthase membrane subunit b/b'